ncbi:MAG: CTP synthase [Candidatus Sungbacteria bacterium RIFCSPHIGHO2_02_FULL_47_11]|uniref:CTP synthase n=1 Tax=Candidatus Sungbacteria bacterium RIFCSPHIGHO2_02_FULL_47_11 TaxID=1802270 RepID=A0A1G2KMK0_9BACT|nr:MAG: CTP synthase [Candidatus Sungbacteria bacterium RIFCSPHIGHO2_02_FULL_47_11]
MSKYIFVCGGVISGVGKGVATASMAMLFKSRGFRVTAVKIDQYLNVDAGTIRPTEHGEVFVTEDGMECDQDIGNYERFLGQDIPAINYLTSGSIYLTVIQRERNLGYDGEDVEVIPHIPEEIIRRIKKAARTARADFVLIEIGGTVGEYQNLVFLEAARMLHLETPQDTLFALVSYLPIPPMIGEMKTKPTQQAARFLNEAGIQPDIIIARSEKPLDRKRKEKLSLFCNVPAEQVISAPDVKSIYEIPLNFERERLTETILKLCNLKATNKNLAVWQKLVHTIHTVKHPVKIGVVGKYFKTGDFTLADSYISVIEAIKHASWSSNADPKIDWLDPEDYERDSQNLKTLKSYNGIIIPGGFGSRGVEGKIKAIEFCRKNKIPFLGLCYGMQLAVIEFTRNVCGLKGAHTTEINPKTKHPVIHTMPEQLVNIREKRMGGSMRLGAYKCALVPSTRAFGAYGVRRISERHRHRYEVNNEFRKRLEQKGLVFSGINLERNLVEIIELPNHPFFVGTQFHPEFKSRPLDPHPLYREFIKAAIKRKA